MNEIVHAGRHSLIHSVSTHSHREWELVYCTWGSGVFRFPDRSIPYREGDVVIIPPDTPHSNSSEGGFRNIFIRMDQLLFGRVPACLSDRKERFLRAAFEAAYHHFVSTAPERASLLMVYGSLICCYLAAWQKDRRPQVVGEIEQDIREHYADSGYELDTYLHSLPFSYDYLRRLFQREAGITPHRYLQELRLQSAAMRISAAGSDGVSMADVAQACGFREPLYFSRMFKKKYGVSPTQYARGLREG